MLEAARVQTSVPAWQRLHSPQRAANHSSLITASIDPYRNMIESHRKSLKTVTSDPNQSLVFVVIFSIARAGGRPFRLTQHSAASRPRSRL